MRHIAITALLGVALAVNAQGQKPDLTVFGQALGKPLSIPECARHSAWDADAHTRRVASDHQALVAAGFKPDAIMRLEADAEARAASAAAGAPMVYLLKGEDAAPCVRSIGYVEVPPIPANSPVLLYFPRGHEPALLGGEYVEATLAAGSVTEMRADS